MAFISGPKMPKKMTYAATRIKRVYLIALVVLLVSLSSSFFLRLSVSKTQDDVTQLSGNLATYSIAVARFGQTLANIMQNSVTHDAQSKEDTVAREAIIGQAKELQSLQIEIHRLVGELNSRFFQPIDVESYFLDPKSDAAIHLKEFEQSVDFFLSGEFESLDWHFSTWAPIALQMRKDGPLIKSLVDVSAAVQQQSRAFAQRSEALRVFLFLLNMSVLFFEAVFLFRPLFKTLEREHDHIIGLNELIERKANELEMQRGLILEALSSVGQSIRLYDGDFWIDLGQGNNDFRFPDQPVHTAIQLEAHLNEAASSENWRIAEIYDDVAYPILINVDFVSNASRWYNVKQVELLGSRLALLASDISKFKEIEASLQDAQRMEAIGSLTSGIAHDFNNILAIIIGNLELMRINVDDRAQLEPKIDATLNTSFRAAAIVNSLLSFSRRNLKSTQHHAIDEILRETEQIAMTAIPSHIHLAVRCEVQGFVKVDAAELQSALINMIVNARDAISHTGHISMTARSVSQHQIEDVQPDSSEQFVSFDVIDDGHGIPSELLDKISQSLFTTKSHGTGLGLSMINNFARDHGGALKFRNNKGAGATFSLILPLHRDQNNPVSTIGALPSKDTRRRSFKGKNVIIIEDEPDLLNVMTSALNMVGFRCYGFTRLSDVQKFTLACADPIDLIITDHDLPDGLGTDIVSKDFSYLHNVPKILISGNDWTEEKRAAYSSFNRILTKPVSIKKLEEVLDDVLLGTS